MDEEETIEETVKRIIIEELDARMMYLFYMGEEEYKKKYLSEED